jgi:IS5 family transposase
MGFCDFSVSGNEPDATTLCRFRKRLVNSSQLEGLLPIVNADLESKNLNVANGKYLSSDATLIQSARWPRKVLELQEDGVDVTYSDDKDASWLPKGDWATYGYSASVTTDEQGLVESVTTFSANRSEMTRLDVLDAVAVKPGQVLLYDKGTDSKDNRALLKARGLKDGIMRKKPKGKPMSHWNRLRNKLIGRRRFVVERTFGAFKRTYGLNRARYLGLIKTQAEVILKSIAYNLKRGVNRYRDVLLQPNCV